jgi:hypothetical protein
LVAGQEALEVLGPEHQPPRVGQRLKVAAVAHPVNGAATDTQRLSDLIRGHDNNHRVNYRRDVAAQSGDIQPVPDPTYLHVSHLNDDGWCARADARWTILCLYEDGRLVEVADWIAGPPAPFAQRVRDAYRRGTD